MFTLLIYYVGNMWLEVEKAEGLWLLPPSVFFQLNLTFERKWEIMEPVYVAL